MRTSYLHRLTRIALCLLFAATLLPLRTTALAPAVATPSGLSFVELKITGDEFVILQNNTASDVTDLSSYWLTTYNNVNPLAANVSSSTQQLPVAILRSGQTLLLSANPMQTCGASVAGKLSLSLGDSGGFMQLSQSSLAANGAIVQTAGDVVSWSSGASGNIQNLPSNTKSPRAAYYRYLNGISYAWQQADLDASNVCQLNFVVAGGLGSSSAVTPLTLAATSPPATILGIVTAANEITSDGVLPSADVGLLAPQLSELLPNPSGSNNDSTDEFIELYNPNNVAFDLSGFSLVTGLTTTHTYVFPAGASLGPLSFKSFYSEETNLTLSNTTSQATFYDPLGNILASSGSYEKAKDGMAWALAKGSWYWTTQVTPDAANVIVQPVAKKSAASKKQTAKRQTTSSKAAAVKGVKKTKLAATTAASTFNEPAKTSVVHGWVLALVASGALLYGLYEYRRDMANRLFQLRKKLGASRANRKSL